MKTKIPLFFLLFGLSLVTINYFLWHGDPQSESVSDPINQTSSNSVSEESSVADFSVEKLNNQASVKQLRRALFEDEELEVSGDVKEVSGSELTADIERLSQEIATLNDSL